MHEAPASASFPASRNAHAPSLPQDFNPPIHLTDSDFAIFTQASPPPASCAGILPSVRSSAPPRPSPACSSPSSPSPPVPSCSSFVFHSSSTSHPHRFVSNALVAGQLYSVVLQSPRSAVPPRRVPRPLALRPSSSPSSSVLSCSSFVLRSSSASLPLYPYRFVSNAPAAHPFVAGKLYSVVL